MFKPKYLFNFTYAMQGTRQVMPGPSSLALKGSSALALPLRTSTATNPLARPLIVYQPQRQLQVLDAIKSLNENKVHIPKMSKSYHEKLHLQPNVLESQAAARHAVRASIDIRYKSKAAQMLATANEMTNGMINSTPWEDDLDLPE